MPPCINLIAEEILQNKCKKLHTRINSGTMVLFLLTCIKHCPAAYTQCGLYAGNYTVAVILSYLSIRKNTRRNIPGAQLYKHVSAAESLASEKVVAFQVLLWQIVPIKHQHWQQ